MYMPPLLFFTIKDLMHLLILSYKNGFCNKKVKLAELNLCAHNYLVLVDICRQ